MNTFARISISVCDQIYALHFWYATAVSIPRHQPNCITNGSLGATNRPWNHGTYQSISTKSQNLQIVTGLPRCLPGRWFFEPLLAANFPKTPPHHLWVVHGATAWPIPNAGGWSGSKSNQAKWTLKPFRISQPQFLDNHWQHSFPRDVHQISVALNPSPHQATQVGSNHQPQRVCQPGLENMTHLAC